MKLSGQAALHILNEMISDSSIPPMSVVLPLSRQQKAELEDRAAAAGIDLPTYILNAVQDQLAEGSGATPAATYDEWHREFQHWIASHPSRNPQFDDSRDSIYD